MTRPVTKVAIVGRDAAAWISALGLQRAFGRIGLEITVVDLPSLLAPVDAYVSLPMLGGLHSLLGIDDRQALSVAGGAYVLGQRFANWSGGRAPFIHAYDTQPMGVNNVDMVQYWVKARAAGMPAAYEDFSLGAAMAKQNKFAEGGALTGGFSRPAHGFHLEARAYVQFLRARATSLGVKGMEGQVAEVLSQGSRILGVRLKSGELIEADLYVDATGAEAALIGALPGGEFQSWRQWLPCDRIIAASTRALNPLPAFSQIAAFRAGWLGLYPLRRRTAVTAVFDSSQMSDHEVADVLPVLTGLPMSGEGFTSALNPGSRAQAWIGNCVAVGDAAVSLEPLDAIPLHVVQTGLSLLVAMFPVDADAMLEAGPYNESMARHAENVRDFQIAHYKLNQRRDDAFWNRARAVEAPETLAYKLKVFSARGRVPLYDDEAFQGPNWTSTFIGHGVIPRDFDPLVDLIPEDEQILQMQRTLQFIAGEVNQMPTLQSQIDALS